MSANPFDRLEQGISKLTERIEVLINELKSQPDVKQSKYLTVTEAAQYLSLAVQTLYSMTSTNRVKFIKKSKKIYFLRSDLDEYLLSGKKESSDHIKLNSRIGKR